MTCPNCKVKLSCSCKIRKATDGKQVCSTCINDYETFLKNNSKGIKSK
jgi:hypothetical protein